MTKRSLFFPDIAASPGLLSTSEKFKLSVDQSVSPADLLVAGMSSGIQQARNIPAGYGQGGEGYGKRFGSGVARNSSSNVFGNFVLASAFHQDPRFFPHGNPKFWASLKYAVYRLVVTRNDSGNQVFNTSGLVGTLASESLANAYLPVSEQTGAKTLERFGTDLGWRAAGNVFKNYWPTIFKGLGLNRLGVVPAPPPNQPAENRR